MFESTEKVVSTIDTSCEKCTRCKDHRFKFIGNGNKDILIIGDYPTEEEGKTVLGNNKYIKFLKSTLFNMGIDFNEDCYYTTTVNCAGDSPSSKEQSCCRPRLLTLINKLKPKSIILLGSMPFDSIIYPRLTGRITGSTYLDFIGECIPDQEYQTYITTVWHPSYLFSTKVYEDNYIGKPLYERDPSVFNMWKNYLKNACSPPPFYVSNYQHDYMCLTTISEAIELLNKACSWEYVAIDYETTGIKPHKKGHEILALSLSDGLIGYSFPFFNDEKFREAVKNFMLSPSKKIAHNIQFEALWTKVILGYWPENWYWDTMVGQHCLNNKAPTGLKFLVYTKFGDIGYDSSVDKYIKSKDKDIYGDNAFNTLKDANIDEVLKYNALDSLYTYKLYEMQNSHMSEFQRKGFDFFIDTTLTFAKLSSRGFCIDIKKLQEVKQKLITNSEIAYNKVMNSDEVKKWDKEEPFNFNSSKQLSHLLFDILKVKPHNMTKSGDKPSVDKDALPKYDLPFIKDILEYRRINKILGTYVAQYEREIVDGKVYPWFSLTRVETFRSAAQNVNIQNVIKRDPEAMEMIRSFVVAPKGFKIEEFDFHALEVGISACHHKDPKFMEYVKDITKDMHGDWALKVFLLKPEELRKPIRQAVKGDFIFASSYGSYYVSMAENLWEDAKALGLIEHLAEHNTFNYKDFEQHIKNVEAEFWEDCFPVYKKWRDKIYASYKERGYVDQFTGFRCYGPMSRNNSYNTPVQGDAAHVLLFVMNEVNRTLERKNMQSHIIGEIHDSLVMYIKEDEEERVSFIIWDFITNKLPKLWNWINVPLLMEQESSILGGTWAEMESRGYLKGE